MCHDQYGLLKVCARLSDVAATASGAGPAASCVIPAAVVPLVAIDRGLGPTRGLREGGVDRSPSFSGIVRSAAAM